MTLMVDLNKLLESSGAEFMRYGDDETLDLQLAESFGAYEAEYAAIRNRVGIMHLPQRRLLQLTGGDVKDFLHRLVTQDIAAMTGGQSLRSFTLSRQGRILADTIIHHGDASTWIECDVHDLAAVESFFDGMLFGEDVALESLADQRTVFALHGPAAVQLLKNLADDDRAIDPIESLPKTHHVVALAGRSCSISRRDECGVPGFFIYARTEDAVDLYRATLDAAGFDSDAPDPMRAPEAAADAMAARRDTLRGRPVGWHAYNTARIEAGTPLFHIDFGPDSLPHETALVAEAVSFTKGCYVGQEIVARMENLGHPKKILVGFKMPDARQPVGGTQLHERLDNDKPGDVVGAVTSSTVSPMLGQTSIGFAMVKWGCHEPGTRIIIPAEGQINIAEITDLKTVHSS